MATKYYRPEGTTEKWTAIPTFTKVKNGALNQWNFQYGTYFRFSTWTSTNYALDTYTPTLGTTIYKGTAASGTPKDIVEFYTYTLKLVGGANGYVGFGYANQTSATIVLDQGTSYPINAKPKDHYVFDKWNEDGTLSASDYVTVNSDMTFNAVFAQSEWQLFVGTESGSGSVTGVTSGAWYATGVNKTITANPSAGNRFLQWADGSVTNPRTITTTASNQTFNARFGSTVWPLKVYRNNDGGTFKVTKNGAASGELASYSQNANSGDTIALDVSLGLVAYNYRFTSWTGDWATSSPSTGNRTMPYSAVTLTANFAIRALHALTIQKDGGTLGTVTLKRNGVTEFDSVETDDSMLASVYDDVEYALSAVTKDDESYRFVGWYEIVAEAEVERSTSPSVIVKQTAPLTLIARFEARPSFTFATGIADGADAYGNTVSLQSPLPDFTVPVDTWLYGRVMNVYAANAAGWSLFQWSIKRTGGETDFTLVAGETKNGVTFANLLLLPISFDTTVEATFELAKHVVNAGVDIASVGCGTVSAGSRPNGSIDAYSPIALPTSVVHGTQVKFTATPLAYAGDADYVFIGWYSKISGAFVSSASEYEVASVIAPIYLVAKFGVNVTVAKSEDGAATGTVTILDEYGATIMNGASAALTTVVTLGGFVTLKAEKGVGTYFRGWYKQTDGSFDTAIREVHQEQLAYPVRHTSLVARFLDAPITKYLHLTNGIYGIGKGELSATGGTEIDSDTYGSAYSGGKTGNYVYPYESEPTVPSGPPPVGIGDGLDKYYVFDESVTTQVLCELLTSVPFVKWQYKYRTDPDGSGNFLETDEWTDFATDAASAQRFLPMVENLVLRANYASEDPIQVYVKYHEDSDMTQGTMRLSPSGDNVVSDTMGVRGDFYQTMMVTMIASPSNGYVFAGWYNHDGTSLVSAEESYTFEVFEPNGELFRAKFVKDTDAVFKWEGTEVRKMMEWRGKRFIGNSPFNLSCARVYADGYPLEITISTSSSPDEPFVEARTTRMNVSSQDVFRLPMRRPEKYVEIGIRSSSAVNEIAASTSMEGVRNG